MERDDFWDYARGFGMILVVLGHTNFVGTDWIYLFHIPLFFIVSGALFSMSSPLYAKISNKFKRLYLPNLKYGLIFLLLHNLFTVLHMYPAGAAYTASDYLRGLIKVILGGNEKLGGAMWFLRALFFSYLLYVCFAMLCKRDYQLTENKKTLCIFLLIVSFCGWMFISESHIYIIRIITIPCIIFPFIVFGKWIQENSLHKLCTKKYSYFFVVLSMTILSLISQYVSIDLAYLRLPNPFLYYSLGCIGFTFVLGSNSILQNTKVYKWIIYIGKHSIPILALHLLSFKLVTFIYILLTNSNIYLLSKHPIPVFSDNIFLPMIYTIVGIGLPLLLNKSGKLLFNKFRRL